MMGFHAKKQRKKQRPQRIFSAIICGICGSFFFPLISLILADKNLILYSQTIRDYSCIRGRKKHLLLHQRCFFLEFSFFSSLLVQPSFLSLCRLFQSFYRVCQISKRSIPVNCNLVARITATFINIRSSRILMRFCI